MARTTGLQLALAALASMVSAAPSISPEDEVPSWATDSTMQLSLSSAAGEVLPPLDYTVMPSTESLGLNQSERARGSVNIEGIMIAATADNVDQITSPAQVAYLSCDQTEDGSSEPDVMLVQLMENKPKAIVLYSTVGNWCRLSGTDLPYESIFTMADAGDSTQALEILNNTNEFDLIQVQIAGNTSSDSSSDSSDDGDNSSVAMSILYTITGLITLLFLAIIGTGAIRAHRHPDRYGPRAGYGGRPSQSRARGLARAVLETIPIVKFGNHEPPKPDPNQDLEDLSGERRDRPVEHPVSEQPARQDEHVSTLGYEVQGRAGVSNGSVQPKTAGIATATTAVLAAAPDESRDNDPPARDEDLGCSICTEDFTVGEDVRLLPCSHKFHPACIDPWLVNVSGTCPLCRLDLRPSTDEGQAFAEGDSASALPPPLNDTDPTEGVTTDSGDNRGRSGRFLDLNRLRHASVEERIQALRQYRSEARDQDERASAAVTNAEGPANATAAEDAAESAHIEPNDGQGRSRKAKLTEKLREKFRIRTRRQGDA